MEITLGTIAETAFARLEIALRTVAVRARRAVAGLEVTLGPVAETAFARLEAALGAVARRAAIVDELVAARLTVEGLARTIRPLAALGSFRPGARLEGLGVLELRRRLGPAFLLGGALATVDGVGLRRRGRADAAGLARGVRQG
ncbi:hypothetical protein D3C80_1480130 [compost metagenome]